MTIFKNQKPGDPGNVFTPIAKFFTTPIATEDTSGNNFVLTQSNSPFTGSYGFYFSNHEKRVNFGGRYYLSSSMFHTTGSLTITGLFFIPDIFSDSSYIAGYGGFASELEERNILWQFYFSGSSTQIAYQHEYDAGIDVVPTSSYRFPIKEWFHLALVKNNPGTNFSIYHNGLLVETVSLSNSSSGGGDPTAILSVGRDLFNSENSYHAVQGLTIYKEELSRQQITYLSRKMLER